MLTVLFNDAVSSSDYIDLPPSGKALYDALYTRHTTREKKATEVKSDDLAGWP